MVGDVAHLSMDELVVEQLEELCHNHEPTCHGFLAWQIGSKDAQFLSVHQKIKASNDGSPISQVESAIRKSIAYYYLVRSS